VLLISASFFDANDASVAKIAVFVDEVLGVLAVGRLL
jgi:hypothetical protein